MKARLRPSLVFLCAVACSPPGSSTIAEAPVPPEECAGLWEGEKAAAVLDTLRLATEPGPSHWVRYDASSSNVVVHAGSGRDSGACVALVRGGATIAFGVLEEAPRFGTPLYGMFSALDAVGGTMPGFANVASQPTAIEDWLRGQGLNSAVLIPVEPDDFPIELPSLLKVQIALHEAFHLDVQGPRWMGHESRWPAWQGPPDRSAVRSCFSGSTEVETAFQAERDALFDLIRTLLDGDVPAACAASRGFSDERASRMRLVSDTRIPMPDGSLGSCADAEAMMELAEGVADYVSWVRLYDVGLASREQLERRYQAQQRDVFYLTGAMKMHALSLLTGDPTTASLGVVNAETVESGSVQALLDAALGRACRAG